MSDFQAKIKGILDTHDIESKLDEISKKQKLELKLDITSENANFDKLLKQLASQMKTSGDSVGQAFAKSFNSSINNIKINHSAIQKKISSGSLDLSISKLISQYSKFADSGHLGLQQVQNDLMEIQILFNKMSDGSSKNIVKDYEELQSILQKVSNNLSIISIDVKDNQADMSQEISKTNKAYSELLSLQKKIGSTKIELTKLDISKDSNQIETLKNQLQDFMAEYNALFEVTSTKLSTEQIDNLIKAFQAADNKLESVSAKMSDTQEKLVKSISSGLSNSQFEKEIAKISSGISNLDNVSDELSDSFMKVKSALNDMNSAQDSGDMDKLISSYQEYQSEIKKTNNLLEISSKQQKSFFSELKAAVVDVAGFTTIYDGIQLLKQGIESGVEAVVELDYALVDLQKTTVATASEYNNFYKEANQIAKEYGETTVGIIQSSADWSRLGYNLQESEVMAQYSSMFKSISPGMTIDEATTGLISTMKAYGIGVEDVLDGVMSKINAVGNTAATSNDQIIEGLERSASAMATMDTSLDKTIAIFTAGQEVVQDASQVGNALKSISLRVRGYDEETEQLSDDLVNITGDVVDLTKAASNNYQGISLFTDETQTQYKDVYDYLQQISGVINEIDAKSKQELLEKLFGKNRANVGAAILNNFQAAEKAMDTMANSAGNAEKEMETVTQSLTFKINALKETGTGIWQNLFAREDVGFVIELLTKLAEVIDFVTEKLGLFGTIGAGVGIAALIKNLD